MHSYLKQRHLLFGSREFIIRGTDALLVREKSLLHRHETLIPLNALQANPTYSSSFSIKWLLTSLFMAVLTGLVVYFAQRFELPVLYTLVVVLAVTTLVLGYRFFLYTTKLAIFRHAFSNENYLYLWRNRPDKIQFENFVNELSVLIKHNNEKSRQANEVDAKSP